MSSRKYVVLIAIGIVCLIALSYTFVHLYHKKNQTTSVLSAIPKDVVALIRLNNHELLSSKDTSSNPFLVAYNPSIAALAQKLIKSTIANEILENPIIVSFHPIGKDKLEPIVLFSSTEEYSEGEVETGLRSVAISFSHLSYNNHKIYKCQIGSETIFLFHSKGITTLSNSLVLSESALRKLDSEYPVETDLQKAYNLTSATSDAALVINFKAIGSWLKSNLLAAGSPFSAALTQSFSWAAIDADISNEAISFSGLFTSADDIKAGAALASMPTTDFTTPQIVSNDINLCLEKNIESITPSSKPTALSKLISNISPRKALLVYVTSSKADSSGFVAVIESSPSDSTQRYIAQKLPLGQPVRVSNDSTGAALAHLLGSAFSYVEPRLALRHGKLIALASSSALLHTWKDQQQLSEINQNHAFKSSWESSLTGNGVASLYARLSAGSNLTKLLLAPKWTKIFTNSIFEKWNAVGFTFTASGSNIIVSGHAAARPNERLQSYHVSISSDRNHRSLVLDRKEASSLIIAQSDTILSVNEMLTKRWELKLADKVDSIFLLTQPQRQVIGIKDRQYLTYLNEAGKIISRFTIPEKIATISDRAIWGDQEQLYLSNKRNEVYNANPFGSKQPQKLFKLSFKPSKLVSIELGSQKLIAACKRQGTEIYNQKGKLLKKLSIALTEGKIIAGDGKLYLWSAGKCTILNARFQQQSPDKMSEHLRNTDQIVELSLGNEHVIALCSGNKVSIVDNDLKIKTSFNLAAKIANIQSVGGGNQIIACDVNSNTYLLTPKGKLEKGYPTKIPNAKYFVYSNDGMLFVITKKNKALESKPVSYFFTDMI